MKFTTMTQPKNRVWAIDFNLEDDELKMDFISPITGEVITGITYCFESEQYIYVPPFDYMELNVSINGKVELPMVAFLNHIISLINLKKLINIGIRETEFVLGWDLDKPRTAEDYMNIAVDYNRYKTVMYIGIDAIRQAVKDCSFCCEDLEREQFKVFFDLVADWGHIYNGLPF